jgi:hypothetical protein
MNLNIARSPPLAYQHVLLPLVDWTTEDKQVQKKYSKVYQITTLRYEQLVLAYDVKIFKHPPLA